MNRPLEEGEELGILVMCALKLLAMPATAFVLARLLALPPVAAGVIVLFAAQQNRRAALPFRTGCVCERPILQLARQFC